MILTVSIVATGNKSLRQKQPNPLMSQVLSLKRAFDKVKMSQLSAPFLT